MVGLSRNCKIPTKNPNTFTNVVALKSKLVRVVRLSMKIFRSVSDMSKVQIIIKVIRILKYWKYNVFDY